jgi:putative addiction module killer protein
VKSPRLGQTGGQRFASAAILEKAPVLRAKARIVARLDRMAEGNFGDAKPVGRGISELQVDHGPGGRVYFMQRGTVLVVVLAGGDKHTQSADIKRARCIASDWEREP